jgi:7-cyano-7-deazaguanine reductase
MKRGLIGGLYNPAVILTSFRAMPSQPAKSLETFDNPQPARDYHIHIEIPEFTCLCPKTGQPDFATLFLDYIPDQRCVELKSLKLYIWSFREEGHFHEDVTNRILDDLARATDPRFMRLTSKFYVRGGIFTNVEAEHRKPGWEPAPRVELTQFAGNSNTRG